MERGLDASVSVLVPEQWQKKCCGVEYRLCVSSGTAAAARRLHRRRLGLQHGRRASALCRLSTNLHAGIQEAKHTCCSSSCSSSESSSWSSAAVFAWPPFAFPASSALFALAAAFFLFFFFCDLDAVPVPARQPVAPRCLTTTRDWDAELTSTSESCSLTYHFVEPDPTWLAQTFWETRYAIATSSRRLIPGTSERTDKPRYQEAFVGCLDLAIRVPFYALLRPVWRYVTSHTSPTIPTAPAKLSPLLPSAHAYSPSSICSLTHRRLDSAITSPSIALLLFTRLSDPTQPTDQAARAFAG